MMKLTGQYEPPKSPTVVLLAKRPTHQRRSSVTTARQMDGQLGGHDREFLRSGSMAEGRPTNQTMRPTHARATVNLSGSAGAATTLPQS
jgi:hypothetical protein